MLTLGSLFDGIGGWQLAAVRAGITPLWSSEIDKFCCTITRRHFPNTIQLGDINGIDCPPRVDIITAGSPCQDISIAGKRGGINGERSGLFFRATDIVHRIKPKFFVWENVPAVLSSNGRNGRLDFKAVLESIAQELLPLPKHWTNAGVVDGRHCQIAWRILDAQFFGVPQRRRRIFLVADFAGRRAAKILFEPAGLSGNSVPCTDAQSATAARIGDSVNFAIYKNHGQDSRIKRLSNVAPTVNAKYGTGGNNPPPTVAYGIGRNAFNQGRNAQFKPTVKRELQPPLTARGAAAVAKDVVRRLTPLECERLQGLPDNWTQGISDTQRYKALGNGMAQPCADFILKNIALKGGIL